MTDEKNSLVSTGELTKPPDVVDAEAVIHKRAWVLAGSGLSISGAYWISAIVTEFVLAPISWWVISLIGLMLLFFYPQDRNGRRAREIMKHWDDIQVKTALEISGASTDPRLQVANTMASRILQHPEFRDGANQVVAGLVESLRQATLDQRTLEVMTEAKDYISTGTPGGRSLSDLHDYIESRIGRLLGTLSEVHAAVVRCDSEAVTGVLEDAVEVLVELEASNEVQQLLDGPYP